MNSIDYNENAEEYCRTTFSVDMSAIYRPFLKLLPPNASILDAGCGSGRDSLYFIEKGYRVTAIDASEKIAEISSKRIGQTVRPISFGQMSFENEFDGIWACASLLHVARSEILAVLKKLHFSLKSGGILFVSFKSENREYQQDRRYFNCYDEGSFIALLANCQGLSLIRMWISEDARPERANEQWLNAVLKKSSMTR